VTCWDTAKGTAIRDIDTHSPVTSLYIPRRGGFFVTGFEDGSIKVWNLLKGEDIYCGTGHGANVTSLAMSSDNSYILSSSSDGSILYWECPVAVSARVRKSSGAEDSARTSRSGHSSTSCKTGRS